MADVITFFDLPSRNGNHCWSPNTWKTRIYLNFKGIPYKTVWIEYPDIKPTFNGKVLPDETGKYSLPTVLLPDGTYVMDSQKIAYEIERRYPSPSIQIDAPCFSRFQPVLDKIISSMRPELIPKVPKFFLNEASQPYFLETRAKLFGMPLDYLENERGGQVCFNNARPFVKEVTAMLQENAGGPFFAGEQVSYADLVWISYLRFVQRIGAETLDQLLAEDKEVHLALLDAGKPWLERDNH